MADAIPFVIEADSERDIGAWITARRSTVDSKLDGPGAVLLRGFDVSTESDFQDVVTAFSQAVVEYEYQSSPRTHLGHGIYTATEYPAGLTIQLHNEASYQRDWPLWILFCCLYPADRGGGETPLADTVKVTNRIDPAIRKKFMEKGVMYIRNYRKDIDLPWQTVFQTQSKAEVEQYCRNHDIAVEWTSSDSLRTRQVCQGVAKHPRTGALVWFNQAHLFHPSGLDKKTRDVLLRMFQEEDFPRNATYGDGSPIEDAEMENVRAAFRQETVTFPWRAGDILILDNMLVSHGRNPYKGKRRVLAAMCDAFSGCATSEERH